VAFTSQADRYLDAAKRLAAQRREPVKKAMEVKLEQLRRMVAKYITPHRKDIFRVDPFMFRKELFAITGIQRTTTGGGGGIKHEKASNI
jgi:aromatic ring-cleaving dioxygenase